MHDFAVAFGAVFKSSQPMAVISEIRRYHGVPTLFVNGQPVPAMAYITYVDELACYSSFGEAGYRLFSCSVCFGDRPINALNRATAMRHGIFEVKGEAHFEHFDEAMMRILEAVPDAMVFPRLNVSPPAWWEEEHPDECNDIGHHGGPRRFSPASQVWREAAKEALRQFFAHVEATPFQEHIIGWQLAGGNTEEWLSTDLNGCQGEASRRAFALASPDDQSPEAYRHFLSVANAEAVMELAHTIKELTGRRLVVGTFYGYLLECPFWASIHHAFADMLRCPDIDFLCSPASYSARLKPELGWPTMTAVASIQHHNKLYFFEFDTRTHRSNLFRDALPNACPPDAYTEPIWQPLPDEEATLNALRMNFAQQMTLGVGSWWFDMWGGWFESSETMAELKSYLVKYKQLMTYHEAACVTRCAAFLDERSYAAFDEALYRPPCVHAARMAMLHSGVPWDIYEISDFAEVIGRYAVAAFIVPSPTPAVQSAQSWCVEHGVPFLEFAEGRCSDAPRVVRDFCVSHGVHCYADGDHAVYVGRGVIALHASSSGEQLIKLPNKQHITPLYPAGESWLGTQIPLCLKRGQTAVFRLSRPIQLKLRDESRTVFCLRP